MTSNDLNKIKKVARSSKDIPNEILWKKLEQSLDLKQKEIKIYKLKSWLIGLTSVAACLGLVFYFQMGNFKQNSSKIYCYKTEQFQIASIDNSPLYDLNKMRDLNEAYK